MTGALLVSTHAAPPGGLPPSNQVFIRLESLRVLHDTATLAAPPGGQFRLLIDRSVRISPGLARNDRGALLVSTHAAPPGGLPPSN